MQKTTTKTATQRTRKPRRKVEGSRPLRGKRSANSALGTTHPNSIFALKLECKPVVECISAITTSDLRTIADPELETVKIFNDLKSAYEQYCKVAHVEQVEYRGVSKTVGIRRMYDHIIRLIEAEHKDASVDICHNSEKDRYFFSVYCYYRFGDALFAFPLQFLWHLEQKKSKLYPYMLQFCGWWLNAASFTHWQSNSWIEYEASIADERAMEWADEDPDVAMQVLRDASFYKEGGIGSHFLNQMNSNAKMPEVGTVNKLKALRLTPRGDFFRKWILEGVELFSRRDSMSIYSMQYDYEFDREEWDTDPVEMERQFIVCWNSEDSIVEAYLESLNNDYQNFGSYSPCHSFEITAEAKAPYQFNTWGHDFKAWFDRGVVSMNATLERYNRKNK